jgi:hypothetical protein
MLKIYNSVFYLWSDVTIRKSFLLSNVKMQWSQVKLKFIN